MHCMSTSSRYSFCHCCMLIESSKTSNFKESSTTRRVQQEEYNKKSATKRVQQKECNKKSTTRRRWFRSFTHPQKDGPKCNSQNQFYRCRWNVHPFVRVATTFQQRIFVPRWVDGSDFKTVRASSSPPPIGHLASAAGQK